MVDERFKIGGRYARGAPFHQPHQVHCFFCPMSPMSPTRLPQRRCPDPAGKRVAGATGVEPTVIAALERGWSFEQSTASALLFLWEAAPDTIARLGQAD
jgi:hypothetical protein